MLYRKKTIMSCPAIERRLRRNHRAGHIPEKQIDDDGFQIVSRSRRRPQTHRRATSVQIETKRFEFNLSRDFDRCSLHLLERRHNLSRSIFILSMASYGWPSHWRSSWKPWNQSSEVEEYIHETELHDQYPGQSQGFPSFELQSSFSTAAMPSFASHKVIGVMAGLSSTATSTDFVSTMKSQPISNNYRPRNPHFP